MTQRTKNSKKIGNTNYGQNVLVSIIELATKEIEGVCDMQGKRVRLQINEKMLKVNVYVKVFIHVQCNEVSFRIQENVKQSVESATDYKVEEVNVNILSVSTERQENRNE